MTDSPFISDVPADAAIAAWRAASEQAGCPRRLPAVRTALADAVGRVTAEPIWARRSSPPYDASAMDGIAVRAADTIGAGPTSPMHLTPSDFEVVDTGDPLPLGGDAVVMREHVHHDDTPEGPRAEIRAAVPPYQHVRSIGEDVATGELLLPEGHRLRPVDIAAAAAAGATDVAVRRVPTVIVIPTGDEIRDIGAATPSVRVTLERVDLGTESCAAAVATGVVFDGPLAAHPNALTTRHAGRRTALHSGRAFTDPQRQQTYRVTLNLDAAAEVPSAMTPAVRFVWATPSP
jgi:putative molybdopterin biosynthesis protein